LLTRRRIHGDQARGLSVQVVAGGQQQVLAPKRTAQGTTKSQPDLEGIQRVSLLSNRETVVPDST